VCVCAMVEHSNFALPLKTLALFLIPVNKTLHNDPIIASGHSLLNGRVLIRAQRLSILVRQVLIRAQRSSMLSQDPALEKQLFWAGSGCVHVSKETEDSQMN